jgi:aminopeptidase
MTSNGEGSNQRLERFAELVLKIGANLAPGQDVLINGLIEHAPFARALAQEAYRLGARYVDVNYAEPHARKARIEHAPEDTLGWIPPWIEGRIDWSIDAEAAHISIAGDPEPDLLAQADPQRSSLERTNFPPARVRQINSEQVNWTIVPYPSPGWANSVYGEPDVERLWNDIEQFMRLDQPDPVAAWQAHIEKLETRARQLNELGLDAVHFEGPGTDLTIGLMEQSRWLAASFTTKWGRKHIPNMPTEEVFTTPDYRRTQGTVRATRPLALSGNVIRDLEMRFENGRAMEVKASTGGEIVSGEQATDEKAAMLGEVALVDGSSPIGQSGNVYLNTLFDENATCHIAYGSGYPHAVEGAEALDNDAQHELGINKSRVHTDFMVGGPEVTVTGVMKDGKRIPIIENDEWQLS